MASEEFLETEITFFIQNDIFRKIFLHSGIKNYPEEIFNFSSQLINKLLEINKELNKKDHLKLSELLENLKEIFSKFHNGFKENQEFKKLFYKKKHFEIYQNISSSEPYDCNIINKPISSLKLIFNSLNYTDTMNEFKNYIPNFDQNPGINEKIEESITKIKRTPIINLHIY